MAGELFKSMTGTYHRAHAVQGQLRRAHRRASAARCDLMFDAVTTMAEQVKAGKVKAIATTGTKRSAVLPDVPTVDEAGVPGYEATIWLGLLAPKGTPRGRRRPAERGGEQDRQPARRAAGLGPAGRHARW